MLTTPNTDQRRAAHAQIVAQQIIYHVARGLSGDALFDAALRDRPCDLDERGNGTFVLSLYGTQTTPQHSATAAMIAWAGMVQNQPDPVHAPDHALRRIRLDIATELELMDPALRHPLMQDTIERTGGTLIPNRAHGPWGPHQTELSVLGISATGEDTDTAIAEWIKHVQRVESECEGCAA